MGAGDILVVVGIGALAAFALGVKLAMPKDKPNVKGDWQARHPPLTAGDLDRLEQGLDLTKLTREEMERLIATARLASRSKSDE